MGHETSENLCEACLGGFIRGSHQEGLVFRGWAVEELVESARSTGSAQEELSRIVEGTSALTSRDQILSSARAALNRRAGDPNPPPPPGLLSEGPETRLGGQIREALEALG